MKNTKKAARVASVKEQLERERREHQMKRLNAITRREAERNSKKALEGGR